MRGGDAVTVLVPHAAGLPAGWEEAGVRAVTVRYAPARHEVLGYGRSLRADERLRGRAAVVAPLYALALRRAVRRRLARERYDLVHAHWLVPNAVALAGAGWTRRVPLAIGLHGSDVFLAERRALRPFARRVLGQARLVTGCSAELVRRVCALGFPAARARVIPYGVDATTFAPRPERRTLWRERLGIPAAAPLVLGVGRMVTKKGFQELVAVLPRLLAERPDLHVVLAGDGDLLPELRAAAVAHAGRVHFPGAVYRDALPDLFRAADLFVLPAVHDRAGNVDGLPNVILEAMASGLAVVASAVSGIPAVVEDGGTGLLVPERDREALAAALLRLLGDPERRAAMGTLARRRAESELSWDAIAARHRESYLAALAGPGGAATA